MQSVLLVLLAIWTTVNARLSPHGRQLLSGLASRSLSSTNITEDAILDITGIVRKNNYTIEEYKVRTEDGYNVTIFRMPKGKTNCLQRIPVFMMHGMYSSAGEWILLGPESSLAYLLVDECFDVWLGNSRGSYYSINPIDAKDKDFWKFSYHDIGHYDVPAMIDFVLMKTKRQNLHYVAHSQGTCEFFVMTSTRPQYNKKIITMVALAPVAFTTHVATPIFTALANISDNMDVFQGMVGNAEFIPSTDFLDMMATKFCDVNWKYFPLCSNFNFQLGGIDPKELKPDMVSTFMGHEPGGGSVWELYHHLEDHKAENFRQFDYGMMRNIHLYGELQPPPYNLRNVVAPVRMFFSENDEFATKEDVLKLSKEISKLIAVTAVPRKNFTHNDFVYAKDVKEIVYNDVIAFLKNNRYRPKFI
ncbi:lipase 3-like [Arctopsyche grandis]|uniref:lipase 3-like n=1 Tax=Arctopsyche grandis TaxID=121162 RepID=UPI00406D96F6